MTKHSRNNQNFYCKGTYRSPCVFVLDSDTYILVIFRHNSLDPETIKLTINECLVFKLIPPDEVFSAETIEKIVALAQ